MVPKTDGTLHICKDFQKLNVISTFEGYPMPRVNKFLDRLGRARYISTLDLTKGYWQVSLTPSPREKTAFSWTELLPVCHTSRRITDTISTGTMSTFTVHRVFGEEVKLVSVMEGDSVTLNSGLTEIMDDDQIQWRFQSENTLIAEINKRADSMTVYDDVLDGRFRNRLKLNNQTGSLTITNTTTQHAGVYELLINRMSTNFILIVHTHLPLPVISRECFSSSSSSSYCSLVCSVLNVSHVTLSWYKGNSLLSSISVSDLSSSVSLHLEVEYQDNNSYSCVINNPISNQTTHLDITQLCHTCSDSVHCCGSTEAVIRLVLSALVGVATVILLVYDIRSRRAEQDQAQINTAGA
ncbi:CD48 antigen-like [Cyprinus carpio]|uniref:CD48 antigen-like n=1 Tax=Cyprinus carpio TaxID=7962 RepID=A0A9R0AR09_CYPCA|nr:CD48 antigen-like [Cyprinus carpio]